MKNIEIREFKLTLEKYINNNGLPIEIKRLVLKEVYEEVEQKTNEMMMLEIKERDGQEEKGREENAESIQPDVLGK